jgi:branched-chain amino acid transport system substrate-binding protein
MYRASRLTFCVSAIAFFATAGTATPQSRPIKVGYSMSLTGGLAGGGRQAALVYDMWAEDVNERGGLLGRKIAMIKYDDQSSPSTIPGIYSKLLDVDAVDLVLSGYGTAVTAAAMPAIMQHQKLFLSLFALAANDQFNYDRYFQMLPTGPNPKTEFSRGYFEIAATIVPRPQTVAIAGADAEFSVLAMEGARENAKKHGFQIVYDRTYPPNTVEFGSVARTMKATNPDLVYIAAYPPDSLAIVRAVHEVGLGAKMLGGDMIGLQFADLKKQLGPLLNGIVAYDLYAPEPTMRFPGVEQFLDRYRQRAATAGVDPLGLYIPPYAYAQMQILEAAVKAVGSLDDAKLAEHIRKSTFDTVVGPITFGSRGEWAEPRILFVQYRGIQSGDLEQFKQAGRAVILHPSRFRSGELTSPFKPMKH